MYFGTMYLSNKGHLMPPNKKGVQNKMLQIQFRLEIEMVKVWFKRERQIKKQRRRRR